MLYLQEFRRQKVFPDALGQVRRTYGHQLLDIVAIVVDGFAERSYHFRWDRHLVLAKIFEQVAAASHTVLSDRYSAKKKDI